ncbi:DNA mismatch repair protein MutS [Tanticharoenia sakaeratensis NBRC 103193]|uniref:DNA mismatch repair protein MutS n=1 Tax=Tanticharoenia sakaeratensis NBRC 103193 TaxID=1231623 RepID=A0A0D6MKF4_9PROT|nr:DNA mismatch repair protein MutS [Tanticharoenia sakaeratensis NBRC 103193]GBQ25295.1 DNA mismatch repair protein MutS [Tanticharoenia sakaeratensis NBRC 103193]
MSPLHKPMIQPVQTPHACTAAHVTYPSPEGATPAMAQWFALKAENPDALLFFRMGDFYELFFGDAQSAATALDISLTTRGTHAGAPIPMCGVPVAAAPAYLARLIRRGFRVAIAEQTATPESRKGGPKGPLPRAIVRLVTPGTLTEDDLLDASRQNLLLALASTGKRSAVRIGAAWIDISTGLFELASVSPMALPDLLARLDPAEILGDPALVTGEYVSRLAPTIAPPAPASARSILSRNLGVAQLDAIGDFPDEQCVAGALAVEYIRRTQAGRLPRLARPAQVETGAVLGLDPATRASLELLRARDGTTEHTLVSAIDRTLTAAGGRLLGLWLASPSTDLSLIIARQDAWSWLVTRTELADPLGRALRSAPDLARALGRLSAGRGQPRDLASVRDALTCADVIAGLLAGAGSAQGPRLIADAEQNLANRVPDLHAALNAALADDLPARVEDGGLIATGYSAELDRARSLRDDSRRVVAELQVRLQAELGLNSLKIRHHAQLGYVVEVPAAMGASLRDRPGLLFRQGTTSVARFSTEELASLDRAILDAGERALVLERQIFASLAEDTLASAALPEIAELFAFLDVVRGAAQLAQGGDWCRPEMRDDTAFTLRAMRHPVVEAALTGDARFVPNDCVLAPDARVMLLTGPNMAGKSTFLRQNAIAVVLAQAGLPLPARSGVIGIVDRLFSRVGAADDLARGRSTFMVEMTETAAILNQAGPRSLVVVDEIGRGTATLDGLAIAWATLEAVHSDLGSRCIFATHFHELTDLADTLPRLAPFTMAVREWRGDVVFQHEVRRGSAKRSWGVHVARLAGVPEVVVRRAAKLLGALEADHARARAPLPLFDAGQAAAPEPHDAPNAHSALHEAVANLDPDAMTPRAALDAIYALRKLALEDDTVLGRG